MIMSMTGFGSRQVHIPGFGKVRIEIRSINHKFLETVFHAPEGFLSLEERLKKEIEMRLKRGRVVCVLDFMNGSAKKVSVNHALLEDYLRVIKIMQRSAGLRENVSLDTLIRLPGVMGLSEARIATQKVWPAIRATLGKSLDDLLRARRAEGKSLQRHLSMRAQKVARSLESVKARFAAVVERKLKTFKTDEEKSSFLRSSDISEEMERLAFHVRNFSQRLQRGGPIGKELDFIAQEMQREANTMGAKSCDPLISGYVIQIKSQIEKVREQAQNVE